MPAQVLDYSGDPCPVPTIEWDRCSPSPVDRKVLWPVDYSCCPHVDDATPAALLNSAAAAASHALWDLTCRKYTVCKETFRPCVPCECSPCECRPTCSYTKLDLHDYTKGRPIQEIDEIRVGGEPIPEGHYRLTHNRFLVPHRTGLLWPWPGQDMNMPEGLQTPSWAVDLYVGELPPPLLLMAASDMACQLVARCLNRPCDIPDNAVSVTREGVTIKLETGLNAIPTVRQALEVYGDCRKKPRTGMWDPVSYHHRIGPWQ